MLQFIYVYFLGIFLLFFMKKIVFFIIFTSFFDKVWNFCNRILTNQNWELVIRNCQWNCMFYTPWKQEKTFCISGVFRPYEMEILVSNGLKVFGRVVHVDIPHKHKSNDLYWKLIYHILSFLNDKGLLIHFNRNLSSEWVP